MRERESKSGRMEFQIRRHPEKKGEEITTPEGVKIPLPVEGIIQAQQKGAELAQQIKDASSNTVFWRFTSNQPRTAEADFVFGQELKVIVRKLPNS